MSALLRRLLAIVAFVGVFAWLLAGAVDQEFASAEGGLSERGSGQEALGAQSDAPGVGETPASSRSESLYQGRAASIRAIRRVFGPRAPAAIRVASCETGGTFYARSIGNAGERGIFQIHPIHFSWAQPHRLFDPVWNSRVAYRLSRGGTRWGPWSCRWAA